MEQLGARRVHVPKVGGSSPPPATKKKIVRNNNTDNAYLAVVGIKDE